MATKTHIAWSFTAVLFIITMGLAGALYRTFERNERLEGAVADLRDEQRRQVSTTDQETEQRLNDESTRLEAELAAAQESQRALTEQLFAANAEVEKLSAELAEKGEPQIKEVTVVKESPYPAFLTLRRAIMAGEPYATQWEVMQQQAVTIDAAVKEPLATHSAGVASRSELQQQLRDHYENAHHEQADDPILSRLSGVLSIRKIDETEEAIRRAVTAGDIDSAAELLRADDAYRDWLSAYDARQQVLQALKLLEKGMEQHG